MYVFPGTPWKAYANSRQDRTIRVWRRDQGQSRDIYHTKRMQRVFRTMWTMDSKYLLSGSDDVRPIHPAFPLFHPHSID
jgi:WD40 repeat protein